MVEKPQVTRRVAGESSDLTRAHSLGCLERLETLDTNTTSYTYNIYIQQWEETRLVTCLSQPRRVRVRVRLVGYPGARVGLVSFTQHFFAQLKRLHLMRIRACLSAVNG